MAEPAYARRNSGTGAWHRHSGWEMRVVERVTEIIFIASLLGLNIAIIARVFG